ncbi:MAG: hypothetical protein ACKOF9_03345, partial [Burkholderiales bacterium]
VDFHATIHRWVLKILPVLAAVFRRRKRPVEPSTLFQMRFEAERPDFGDVWSVDQLLEVVSVFGVLGVI